MKYTTALAFFLSLLALVSSALIAREAEPVDALAKDPSDKPTFVPSTLPDGRRRITLFENGAFAGSITEGTAGSGENYTYVDPSNNAISATKFLTAETVQAQGASDGLRFPWPPISPLLKLLRRFAGLITKWGRRFFVSPCWLFDESERDRQFLVHFRSIHTNTKLHIELPGLRRRRGWLGVCG